MAALLRGQRLPLFLLLVKMLHEQHHYAWTTAAREGFYLARAAATFGATAGDAGRVVPDLEQAYRIARDWVHAGFDARALARAELAWWVARRSPADNDPERVGQLMAEAYGLLYEMPPEQMAAAARLRARAAALRDSEAGHPDWQTIGQLLRASYVELRSLD